MNASLLFAATVGEEGSGDLRGVNFGGRTGNRVRASEFERFLAEREGNAAA